MIALAQVQGASAAGPGRMTVVDADFLACPIEAAPASTSRAPTPPLHHMDFAAALRPPWPARSVRAAVSRSCGLAAHGSARRLPDRRAGHARQLGLPGRPRPGRARRSH